MEATKSPEERQAMEALWITTIGGSDLTYDGRKVTPEHMRSLARLDKDFVRRTANKVLNRAARMNIIPTKYSGTKRKEFLAEMYALVTNENAYRSIPADAAYLKFAQALHSSLKESKPERIISSLEKN